MKVIETPSDGYFDRRVDRITSGGEIVATIWPDTYRPSRMVRYHNQVTDVEIDVITGDQDMWPYCFHFEVYHGSAYVGCGVATATAASNVLMALLRQDKYYESQQMWLIDLPKYAHMKRDHGFGRKLPNRHQRNRLDGSRV